MAKQSDRNRDLPVQLQRGLLEEQQRPSTERIYEYVMRGGGEPFGRPYEAGPSTLTEKLVKLLGQRSFFRFESFDPRRPRGKVNKFTRYGAAPFTGEYFKKRR